VNKAILGVIAYLDSVEVDNLLASIEGGLAEQFVEKFKEAKGKKGKGNLGVPGTNAGVSLESVREEAREATKKTTPVSRLSVLRKILIDNDYIKYVNVVDAELRDKLIEGQLSEIYGEIRVSAFGKFVDIAVEFLNLRTKFSGLFGDARPIDSATEQGIRYLEHITSKGVPVYVTCPKQPDTKRGFEFASIFNPGNLMLPKENLSGTFNLLGRVKRVLAPNEVVYLYDLIPGMSMIPRNQFKALMKNFPKESIPDFDLTITEKDLRLKHPTVVISPIAMYS
jgi:hypothetical protein